MADQKVSALTTIPAVDRAADLLYIVDTSAGSSNKTTPNQLLGITGAPVGDTDSQSLANKTLTSPTISSPTLSGTVTGTYTLGGTPTFPAAVVTLTGSQELTNKTLTSPTINTPTIVNPTMTADTISEYSVGNGVTLDGVNLKDGALNTNNSVVTSNITDLAVTPPKVASFDWFKFIHAYAYTSTVGTLTLRVPNEIGTNNPNSYAVETTTQNTAITYKTVLQAGTYTIGIAHDKDANRGIYTLKIDGNTVGSTVDGYNATRVNNVYSTFTTSYSLATSALVTVVISLDTKNASSSGYNSSYMWLLFRRTA